ncbi:MAG: uroporphyrinogen-III synthase [Saprospiraceae bacterium]|nr:uroporphyrinogen-III synthase [Saprospiraceae bacterium]
MKVKNILVSQPKPVDFEKSPYSVLSKKHNINIDFHKFITIEGVTASEFRKCRIDILAHTAIILTSRQAVDHFFRIAKEMRVEIPDSMKYFCISESTAFYLQKYVQFRKRKIFSGQLNFDSLMKVIKKHSTETYLLPCSEIHKQDIPKKLKEHKIKFTKAVIYRTKANDLSDLDISAYDMFVFFSPSGVKSLKKNFPEFEQNGHVMAAFGPTTAKAIKDEDFRLDINAPTKTAPSMTMAIEQYLIKEAKKKK